MLIVEAARRDDLGQRESEPRRGEEFVLVSSEQSLWANARMDKTDDVFDPIHHLSMNSDLSVPGLDRDSLQEPWRSSALKGSPEVSAMQKVPAALRHGCEFSWEGPAR